MGRETIRMNGRQALLGCVLAAGAVSAAACSPPERPSVVPPIGNAVSTNCEAEVAPTPAQWPLALPDSVTATGFSVEDNTYAATGVTGNAELTLNQALDGSFSGFEFDEPSGGANEVIVPFRSEVGEGTFVLTDEDEDSCWDLALDVIFSGEPPLEVDLAVTAPTTEAGSDAAGANAEGTEADGSGSGDSDAEGSNELDGGTLDSGSGLVDPAGSGTVTISTGTEQLFVTECGLQPVRVVARSESGLYELGGEDGSAVALRWTDNDEVERSDDEAKLINRSENAIAAAGEIERSDGFAESIIIDIICNEAS